MAQGARPSGFAVDAERLNAALVQVRARLGDTATDAALAEGKAFSLRRRIRCQAPRSDGARACRRRARHAPRENALVAIRP